MLRVGVYTLSTGETVSWQHYRHLTTYVHAFGPAARRSGISRLCCQVYVWFVGNLKQTQHDCVSQILEIDADVFVKCSLHQLFGGVYRRCIVHTDEDNSHVECKAGILALYILSSTLVMSLYNKTSVVLLSVDDSKHSHCRACVRACVCVGPNKMSHSECENRKY